MPANVRKMGSKFRICEGNTTTLVRNDAGAPAQAEKDKQ